MARTGTIARSTAAMLMAIALALTLAALPQTSDPAAAASTASAPQPVVDGATLRDARTGARWIPHGVNWPGFEYSCVQGWVPSYSAHEASAIASWGVDVVRLPLNQDCWLGVDGAPTAGAGTSAAYRSRVAEWVGMLHAVGLAVILDLHWSAPAGVRADGQRAMADAQSVQFWSSVATVYAGDPSVMFELFNEPYSFWNPSGSGYAFDLSWSCWRDGGCEAPIEADTASSLGGTRYPVAGMSELLDAVREAGATQPVLLGGRNYSNDLGQWLASRPDDDQLIAAWHNYQGQGCSTSCWNSTITTVAATVPVLMTEFGDTSGGHAYFDSVVTWAQAHAIGVIPWAWWDVDPSESLDNSRYALYDGDFVPRAPSGTAYRAFLSSLSAVSADDAATAYVLACYTDVLGRTPSRTGTEVGFWVAALRTGTPRSAVADGFTGSDEYRLKMIDAAYRDVLGREPEASGRAWWLNAMRAGHVQPDDAHRAFLGTPEFFTRSGGTAAAYVAALYRDILGREPEPSGTTFWSTVLAASGRTAVVDGMWTADETARKRVAAAYLTLLGRAASASEQNYWAAVARTGGPTSMRSALLASAEYADRALTRFPPA